MCSVERCPYSVSPFTGWPRGDPCHGPLLTVWDTFFALSLGDNPPHETRDLQRNTSASIILTRVDSTTRFAITDFSHTWLITRILVLLHKTYCIHMIVAHIVTSST